jgi:hypothetical protein
MARTMNLVSLAARLSAVAHHAQHLKVGTVVEGAEFVLVARTRQRDDVVDLKPLV